MASRDFNIEQWTTEKVFAILREWIGESAPDVHPIGVHSVTEMRPAGKTRWTSKVHVIYVLSNQPAGDKKCREVSIDSQLY